jgi:hypothetical protein
METNDNSRRTSTILQDTIKFVIVINGTAQRKIEHNVTFMQETAA